MQEFSQPAYVLKTKPGEQKNYLILVIIYRKTLPEPIHYKHSAVYNIKQYLTGKNLKDGMDFKYALKHVIIFRRFVTGKNKWT